MAAADYNGLVQSLYISYFGRPADSGGLQNFTAQLDALKAPLTVQALANAYKTTPALKTLIDQFGTSAESNALYTGDTVSFVSAIYANVLNRAPDVAGALYWAGEIDAGRLTKANASLAIQAGAMSNTTPQGLIDAAVLSAKIAVASAFTTSIDTGVELAAYTGNAAAAVARDMLKTVTATSTVTGFQATIDQTLQKLVDASQVGSTFTLTSSVVDNFVGTGMNDTFNALQTTGGNSTLNGFDSIDGGLGNDTLNIVNTDTANLLSIPASVTIKNIETVNLTSVSAITYAAGAGVTKVSAQAQSGDITVTGAVAATVTTAAGSVTVGSTTSKATGDVIAKATGGTVTVIGGANVSTTSDGIVNISKATGKVAVVSTTTTNGAISVLGGTSVSVTTAANSGAIAVGAAATTTIDGTTGKQTINNLADIASGDITISNSTTSGTTTTYGTGVTTVNTNGAKSVVISGAGATSITDVNTIALIPATGGTAVAGTSTLTTVSLTGVTGATTVASNALNALQVNSSTSAVTATVVGAHALTVAANNNTGASVTDNTATSVALSATGTTTNSIAVNGAKLNALTIGGDGAKFTLGGLTMDTAVTGTIAVTGAVKADLGNLSGLLKLASVDSTANTGSVKATLGNATAFTGGAGADTITVGATTKAIALGDGNDTIVVTAALGTGGSITGGNGTDTLSMTSALAAAVSVDNGFAGKVTGFEALTLDASAVTAGGDVINLDVLGGYNSVTTGGASDLVSLQGMASGGTLKLTSSVGAGSYVVGITSALASTNDVLNVSLSGSGALTAGSVTAANVESINITTADTSTAGGSTDSLTLVATAAKSITAAGSAGLTLTDTGAALTSVDASGITAGTFTFASGALAAAATVKGSATAANVVDFSLALKGVTYTGGSAADSVVLNSQANVVTLGDGANVVTGGAAGNQTITGGKDADTVTLGSGNNTVNLGDGANTFTAGNGNNTYVGGKGVDLVTVGSGANVITTGAGADIITFNANSVNGNSYSTIMDAHSGLKIVVAGSAGAATLAAAPASLAPTAVFQDYLDAATVGDGGAATTLQWFVYGGNTYIVADHSSATTFQNGVDSVIKLVGVVDLTATGATYSAGGITLK